MTSRQMLKTLPALLLLVPALFILGEVHFNPTLMVFGCIAGAVLGDIEALQGVRQYPVRIKCASLSWNVLLDALNSQS